MKQLTGIAVITQCEIRHLYNKKGEPGIYEAIELAKTFERRRCGHHPDQHPEPLPASECMLSVVDPSSTGVNKHRYVVASQSQPVRQLLRGVRGVPLIYIKRSVMILEPMADESVQVRAKEERAKFRAEIKSKLGKRKRDEDEDDKDDKNKGEGEVKKKKKKNYGAAKGPNPLSVKKKKKKTTTAAPTEANAKTEDGEEPAKRKRKRKSKKAKTEGEENGETNGEAGTGAVDDGGDE